MVLKVCSTYLDGRAAATAAVGDDGGFVGCVCVCVFVGTHLQWWRSEDIS